MPVMSLAVDTEQQRAAVSSLTCALTQGRSPTPVMRLAVGTLQLGKALLPSIRRAYTQRPDWRGVAWDTAHLVVQLLYPRHLCWKAVYKCFIELSPSLSPPLPLPTQPACSNCFAHPTHTAGSCYSCLGDTSVAQQLPGAALTLASSASWGAGCLFWKTDWGIE
jgi:hypothetical protein